ncbi:MAG: hypothetical protein IJA20_02880 [Methanocorpusculum sp.]|nr:hypothetical protein [Oscillospiraceae bacterium]MBQ3569600.1 hypothetical protein [Methanocorpusculum sp.]
MKREKLCDAMNLLPDDIIHETENVRAGKKRGNKTWLKWGTAVACLCLVIIGTLTLPMLRQSPGGEHDEPATDNYPYNDTDVLDYIGMPLEDLETDNGTVVFNEITDIEAYRKFNTNYGYEDKPYYSTRTTAYDFLTWYPVASENDFINVAIFERDGSIENCPNYDEFLQFKDRAPIAADLVLEIFEKGDTTHADAYYNGSIDSYGISFRPESNCVATVVIGKDIASIDSRFEHILPIFQSALGTENSSYIGGQEVSIHYFYQNRLFRDSKTEEAYQYYVYFERDGLQYLYQFSSNWSLIGKDVSALHNPPSTLHYVETQDECRELFLEYLFMLASK